MNEHARVRTPGDDARVDVAHTRRASNVQIAKLITHCICSLLDIVCVFPHKYNIFARAARFIFISFVRAKL